MRIENQVRWIYKPLVFVGALLPLARLVAGGFEVVGHSLGADPINEIQDVLGKWALNFLLITLCVTPLRQISGMNALLRFRRMLGLFAFVYTGLHFLTYVLLDRSLDLATLLEDVVRRPYITIGFTALAMLVPLAATSTNRMMRRLGRRWQTLHRLVYPIAILGVWHYYWQVKADVREPLIYVGVITLLLGYRCVVWLGRLNASALRRTATGASRLAGARDGVTS